MKNTRYNGFVNPLRHDILHHTSCVNQSNPCEVCFKNKSQTPVKAV